MAVSEKLQLFLREHDVACELRLHPQAFTAQETAEAAHVPGRAMAKTVIVRGGSGRYLMAVLPAPNVMDLGALAEAAGEKRVSLATEDEVFRLFPDCEKGAMPPFGNLYNLPVYVDSALALSGAIAFSAGSHRESVMMDYDDYASLVGPHVLDLSTHRGH